MKAEMWDVRGSEQVGTGEQYSTVLVQYEQSPALYCVEKT